jgi:hypothetical protein
MNNKTIEDYIKDMEKTVTRIKNISRMEIDIPEETYIKEELIKNEVEKLYL